MNYETAKEFPLKRPENKAVKLDWRVNAMELIKVGARSTASQTSPKKEIRDAVESVPTDSIIYNDFLTLSGIPAEVYDYRPGNRSALEWRIDQSRVTRDEQGNLASDPNRLDDEQYIVRLTGQVISASLETVKVVKGFPREFYEGRATDDRNQSELRSLWISNTTRHFQQHRCFNYRI